MNYSKDNNTILKLVFSDNIAEFEANLNLLIKELTDTNFSIWSISGNISTLKYSTIIKNTSALDIFELGFDDDSIYSEVSRDIVFFEETFHIYSSFFLKYKDSNLYAITFHSYINNDIKDNFLAIAPYISKRVYDIIFKEKQIDLYVDYQKKVDFIKKGSVIFKAINMSEVIALSLNFFMELFSAQAVFAIYEDKFYGIAVSEDDIENEISINNQSLKEFSATINETELFENIVLSKKFNIKNIFFVYEKTSKLLFGLFNISFDIIPDKEFSELVTNIVSIATENASNHEEMLAFKLEETEMSHTVDILNRFVKRVISYDDKPEIYAVNYPARSAGGDFVEVVRTDNKIIFAVADVCGKGYSAAVFTVVLSVFSTLIPNTNLADAIEEINKFLITKNFADRFITGFFGIIDIAKNELEYLSCGHDPAFIVKSGEPTIILKSQYLPLGLMQETYKSSTATISDGSLLCVYTDGLIEYITFEELVEKVEKIYTNTPKNIVDKLYADLVPDISLQRDDFTCILIKF